MQGFDVESQCKDQYPFPEFTTAMVFCPPSPFFSPLHMENVEVGSFFEEEVGEAVSYHMEILAAPDCSLCIGT